MRWLYTLIFYLAIPVILLRLLWRALAAPAYAHRWAERFGFFSRPVVDARKKVVWLHTVSVGEFLAALPMIRQLLLRGDVQLVITTTTPTGSERVKATLGDSVFHVYAPYDIPDAIGRFLRRVKPSLMLIMETELWPNIIAACARRQIPVVLVNARMSARSARGYARFAAITRPMLSQLTLALVQNTTDAARLQQLGLPVANTRITGNIKFDLTLSDELRTKAAALKQLWSHNGERHIWIAASTHLGEDEIILEAFAQAEQKLGQGKLLLVLVPRHPERFESVFNLCRQRGFNTVKRSHQTCSASDQVVLGDTMGELLLLFGASDIAFVGGSLVPNGGHNFIEPAAWQLPLISGEHVFNFAEVAHLLQDAGGLLLLNSADALANQVVDWVQYPEMARQTGEAAFKVANENRGALAKTLDEINHFL